MLSADYSCHSDARLHLSTFSVKEDNPANIQNFLILFLHQALQLWFTLFTLYYMSSSCIIMPVFYVCTVLAIIRPPFVFTTRVCFTTVAH